MWRQDLTEGQALALCLALGSRFQAALDGQSLGPWQEDEFLQAQALGKRGDSRPLLELHRNLEILTPEWRKLLDEALAFGGPEPYLPETGELRNLAAYYLYRYWFQAVADYDCLVKLRLLAVNWAVVRRLQAVHLAKTGSLPQEARLRLYQLYAKEVEHDEVNRTALEEALLGEAFSLENLLDLI